MMKATKRQSRLIKGTLEGSNVSEMNMHDHVQQLDMRILQDGRLQLAQRLAKQYHIRGNVLELGSGHSWMTGMMSKEPTVDSCWCVDSSKRLITQAAPLVFRAIGAMQQKITRVYGSFYSVPCKDKFFDFVIFEASFHHVPDYTRIFKELRRVLKPDGVILCTRERYLPLGVFESNTKYLSYVQEGILERTFTIPEYRFLAELNYFHLFVEPIYWYPEKNRKWKHWAKWFVEKIPLLNTYLAFKYSSLVMVMRPKPYDPIKKR